jgi:hypothetical protein
MGKVAVGRGTAGASATVIAATTVGVGGGVAVAGGGVAVIRTDSTGGNTETKG